MFLFFDNSKWYTKFIACLCFWTRHFWHTKLGSNISTRPIFSTNLLGQRHGRLQRAQFGSPHSRGGHRWVVLGFRRWGNGPLTPTWDVWSCGWDLMIKCCVFLGGLWRFTSWNHMISYDFVVDEMEKLVLYMTFHSNVPSSTPNSSLTFLQRGSQFRTNMCE